MSRGARGRASRWLAPPWTLERLEPYAVAATVLVGADGAVGGPPSGVLALVLMDWVLFLAVRGPRPGRPRPSDPRTSSSLFVQGWMPSLLSGLAGLLLAMAPSDASLGTRELLLALFAAGLAYLLLPPRPAARPLPRGWRWIVEG